MTTVPERYQPQTPTAWMGETPLTGPVELSGEREPVVWVPSALNPNEMVAVPKSLVQPMQPAQARDLTPQMVLDPMAQRMIGAGIGGGVFSAGAGWGIGQAFNGLAGLGTGGLMWLAFLVVASRFAPGRGRGTTVNKTVINNNSWWGRSSTSA